MAAPDAAEAAAGPTTHPHGPRTRPRADPAPWRARRCNRLQALTEFEGAKHTCRAQLAEHNERRRNTRALPEAGGGDTVEHVNKARRTAVEAALRPSRRQRDVSSPQSSAGAAPPRRETSPLQAALQNGLFDLGDWLADELDEDTGTGTGGDSSGMGPGSDSSGMIGAPSALPAATVAFAAAWPEAARGDGAAAGEATPGAAYALFLAGASAAAAAVSAELRGRRLHVKLLADSTVVAAASEDVHSAAVLQPPAALLPLPASLGHLFQDARTVGDAPLLEALGMAVRPGCMLLTIEALMPAELAAGADADAAEVLRRALRLPGAAGDFLRAQRTMLVADAAGGEATVTRGADGAAPRSIEEGLVAMTAPPPPVTPLALLLPGGEEGEGDDVAALSFETPLPDGAAVHCRTSGGTVLAVSRDGAGGARLSLRAPAGGARLAEGCALLELLPKGVPLHRAGEPRPLLLTADAAIAAEVAAAGDAAQGAPAARAHVERAVTALGAALAPDAKPRVVVAAATATLWMGWPASLRALLARPALADGSAEANARLLSLLAHAASAGRTEMLAALCAGAPPLADGGALTAALLRAAREQGHARAALAVAAARDALQARTSAAADASPAAAAAASALLAATAAALDSVEAKAVKRATAAAAARCDIDAAAAAAAVAHAADSDVCAARVIQQPTEGDAAAERALYDAHNTVVHAPTARIYYLLVMSLDVIAMVRRVDLRRRGHIPPALLATLGVLSVDELSRAHFYFHSWSCPLLTVAMLALLAGPPGGQLRRFYRQHATALQAAHWATLFVLTHVVFELYLRRWLALPATAALLPRWWTVGQLNITASTAAAPLPVRHLVALMALRAALNFAPVSWSVWPHGLPLFGALTQARANAALSIVLAAALLAQDRRQFRAWRAARAAAALRAAKKAE